MPSRHDQDNDQDDDQYLCIVRGLIQTTCTDNSCMNETQHQHPHNDDNELDLWIVETHGEHGANALFAAPFHQMMWHLFSKHRRWREAFELVLHALTHHRRRTSLAMGYLVLMQLFIDRSIYRYIYRYI
jgi:hypothetical protein